MKKSEILGEVPKYGTETKSEQNALGKMALINLPNTARLPQTFDFWQKMQYLQSVIKQSAVKQ